MATRRNKRTKLDTLVSPISPAKFRGQDYQKLKQYYLNNNQKYTDDQFPPDHTSIGPDLLSKEQLDTVVWKRPSELVTDPCLVVDGESRFDFAQGQLGNCWFLAAIGAITFQRNIMVQVVPAYQGFGQDYTGVFHFRFWRYGRWVDVVVDDKLPTIDGELIFVDCKTHNEFWPALLEKAYAKVHGSYAALHGGFIFNALRDFTGGAFKTFMLSEAPEELWGLIQRAEQSRALMGCATPNGETPENTVLPSGLVEGHAYAVTGVTQVKTLRKTVKLVRLLNPWGYGEWNGDWSDKSPLWDKVKEEDHKKWLEDKENGEFWMSVKDFCRTFEYVDICCVSSTFLTEPRPASVLI